MENLEFMKKFRPEELCIKEFKYWIVCARKKQVTLGDTIIALKRETPNMSDMTKEEAAELVEVTKWYENTCKEKLGAIKFNYIAMMMHDFFIHYHVFPRYDKKINLFDMEWEDRNPLNYFGSVEDTEDDILLKIINYMK
mgnify:FL=1